MLCHLGNKFNKIVINMQLVSVPWYQFLILSNTDYVVKYSTAEFWSD